MKMTEHVFSGLDHVNLVYITNYKYWFTHTHTHTQMVLPPLERNFLWQIWTRNSCYNFWVW